LLGFGPCRARRFVKGLSLMPLSDRVLHPGLRRKIMSAEAAAALIPAGANVGTSGFTGAGYPKAVPQALAQRIKLLHADGEDFQIGLWTGAFETILFS